MIYARIATPTMAVRIITRVFLLAASFLSWAWMRGDFKDVEGPKFDMLEGELSENTKMEPKTEPTENRAG